MLNKCLSTYLSIPLSICLGEQSLKGGEESTTGGAAKEDDISSQSTGEAKGRYVECKFV